MGRCPHCRRRVIPLRWKYSAALPSGSIRCPACGGRSELPAWTIGLALPGLAALFVFSLLESRTTAYAVLLGTVLTSLCALALLPLVPQR
jgi:hypothetical protein